VKRPFAIRPARAADAAAILRLEQQFPSDRMSARSVRHFLKTPTAQVWMALASGEVAGCLILLTRRGSKVGRIYSVVVSPAQRGRGLGMRLVETAERWAQAQDLAWVSLEVRLDNAAARALYAKRGYQEAARLPGYYDDGAPGLRLRRMFARVERGGRRV
jgi:ribosomal protein S18 acetylase RimI-like enzyme